MPFCNQQRTRLIGRLNVHLVRTEQDVTAERKLAVPRQRRARTGMHSVADPQTLLCWNSKQRRAVCLRRILIQRSRLTPMLMLRVSCQSLGRDLSSTGTSNSKKTQRLKIWKFSRVRGAEDIIADMRLKVDAPYRFAANGGARRSAAKCRKKQAK